MQCTSCDYPDSKVVETNKDERFNQIYRRRECIRCGFRFTTQEHMKDSNKRQDYKTKPPRFILDK